jgi:hypothetical protein
MPQVFDFDGIDPRSVVLYFAQLQLARHFDAVRAIRPSAERDPLAVDRQNPVIESGGSSSAET